MCAGGDSTEVAPEPAAIYKEDRLGNLVRREDGSEVPPKPDAVYPPYRLGILKREEEEKPDQADGATPVYVHGWLVIPTDVNQ